MSSGAISALGAGALQSVNQSIQSASSNFIQSLNQGILTGQNALKSGFSSAQTAAQSALGQSSNTSTFLNSLINNYTQLGTNSGGFSMQDMQNFIKSKAAGSHGKHGGHGSGGITKNDLVTLENNIKSSGGTVPSLVSEMADSFDQIDTNGDGKISTSEFENWAKSQGWSLSGTPAGNGTAPTSTLPSQLSPSINSVLATTAASQLQSASTSTQQLIANYGQYGLNTGTAIAGSILTKVL